MEKIRKNIAAVLAALIWGTAFVAQSFGAALMPPFAFNTIRSVIATLSLILVVVLFAKVKKEPILPPKGKRKELLIGGICCGAALAIASAFQQAGLAYTDPGKGGFITALYIVLVPIAGLFFKKRAPFTVWIAVGVAAAGLYFLCIKESFTVEAGDLLILCSAFCYTAQILIIDHFTERVESVRLSCVQFFVVTVISGLLMLLFEQPDWSVLPRCTIPLLYTGVLSSGVAYTLQIVAQKGSNPTVISLLLSLESVFAVLAGLVFGDTMSGREWLGCGLMLAAVVFAQLPPLDFRRKRV
ncbi:MAG: DMT family transporter [Clostridia bacterium]|nr:DMT family transporter [Clostridia bacterium]